MGDATRVIRSSDKPRSSDEVAYGIGETRGSRRERLAGATAVVHASFDMDIVWT